MAKKKSKSWADRLKEIRLRNGISQRRLGIAAGLDAFVASARMNRYENGIHDPEPGISKRIAEALGVPNAMLYAEEDDLAELIEVYSRLDTKSKAQVLELAKALLAEE